MVSFIGVDIIEINRIEKAISKTSFLKKIYTDKEISLVKKSGKRTAAANFAAKEAVAKAMGVGFRGFSPKDIEILRDRYGKPFVLLHNNARTLSRKLGIKTFNVSLSHCKEYAIAFVVA